MQYELFYLIGASKEAELEKIKSEVEKIVKHSGGVFSEKTTLEKRRLSYEVKHETHGIYIARRFKLEELENLKNITSKLNLYADILRFIISRADELPELKSKEERIRDAAKIETQSNIKSEDKAEVKKPEAKKKKELEIKKEDIKEKEEVKEEDIDKKLEEILNI